MDIGKVRFFDSAGAFRKWLQKNHDPVDVLWVGYYKKASGRPSITYSQSVDEALCFGWIDGVRKSIDEDCYTVRFTPRRPGSGWSQVNIRRVEALKARGAMAAPGLKAFEGRDRKRAGYSFEERPQRFDPKLEKLFKANARAWRFFGAQPPGYRRTVIFYVVSAVKDETKLKRLDVLIEASAREQRLGPGQEGVTRQAGMSSDHSTRATIDRFNEAINRHDVAAVTALLDERTVFENTAPPPDGTRIEGKAAVSAFWETWFASNPGAQFEAEEVIIAGDRAVVRWVYRKLRDGKPWHLRGIDVFTVRNGRILSKLAYVKG